jgi:signal peptidase I
MIKNFTLFLWETIKVVLVALLIVIPIRYFLFQPFIVSGQSMEPNYSHGDYLIVDEISYRFREPQRGEVIVFRYPEEPSLRHIKRVIGLPQETINIENGVIEIVTISGEKMTLDESGYLTNFSTSGNTNISLKEKQYFVMGDNRSASFDSRRWGSLAQEYIIGRVALKVFPFSNLRVSHAPQY